MTITDPSAAPPAASIPFETRTVEADGFTVSYQVGGQGAPLIALHGAGGPNLNLGLRLLAERSRIHLIELPGYGEVVNTRTESTRDMARTVLAIADALGLEEFDLLGTSMGGAIAAWTAVEGPDRIRHLVLEAPAAFRPDRDPSTLSPEELFQAFHAHPERKEIAPPDPEAQRRVWPLVERLVGPLYDHDLAERLRTLPVPTLVLYGSKDGLFGTAPGNEYKRLLPMCTFAIVYDAAHDIAGDRPEAFAAIIDDFLTRGIEFAVQNRSTLIHP